MKEHYELALGITRIVIGAFVFFVGVYALSGFDVSSTSGTTWPNNQSYGGDAYTGIQNAAAAAARNAGNIYSLVDDQLAGFAKLFSVLGLVMVAAGLYCVCRGTIGTVSAASQLRSASASNTSKSKDNSAASAELTINEFADEPQGFVETQEESGTEKDEAAQSAE